MDTNQFVERLSEESGKTSRLVTKVGLSLTAIYILSMLAYVFCALEDMLKMRPNEFGDFLAGVFGPLALFWLVCGYFQQGVELRNNARALHLQALELKNSSEALRGQVKEMQSSVEQQKEMARLASEQLRHSLDSQRRAIIERNRAENPDFVIVESVMHSTKADSVGRLQVNNKGAPVTVTGRQSNSMHDSWEVPLNQWATGIKVVFVPMRTLRNRGVPVIASIDFRCASGRTGKLKIIYEIGKDDFEKAQIITEFSDDDLV